MNNKNIKIIIAITIVLFILSAFTIMYINNKSNFLYDIQLKVSNNHLLQKNVKFELYNVYHSNFTNYDRLNMSQIRILKDIHNIIKIHPECSRLRKIEKLLKKQKSDIEYIKSSNSLLMTSFHFLRYFLYAHFAKIKKIDDANFLTLKLLSRKIVDDFYNIKYKENSTINEYIKHLNKIKSIKLTDPKLINFRKKFIKHSKLIIENAKILREHLTDFEKANSKIDDIYRKIKVLKTKERKEETRLLLATQILTASLFITLLVLIFRFINLEETHKKREKYLRKMIDKHIATSTTNIHGTIKKVSKAFCKLTGYKKEELVGKSHNIIRHPDVPKEFFKDLWETILSKKTWRGKIKNKKKNGETFWINSVIEPILDKKGNIIEFYAIESDITSTMKLKELTKNQEKIIEEKTALANERRDKAIAAVRAKDQFLANMSHEIRTPLNAILGFLDLLEEREKNEESKKYIGIIKNSSQSLLEIINDILDFSKIESGKMEIEKIDFEPEKEFELLYQIFKARLKEKDINLHISLKGLPPHLHGDILRIKQVINNLLSNAIKFTPNGKNIYLNIEYKDGLLCVSIKDEGIGISKDYQEKIFHPFTQEDSSTTRKYGGTGLGLAISYNLIKDMGGELKLNSEVGQGSKFYFCLPLSLGSDNKKESVEKISYNFNSHILVVEDNKSNQMFIKILLKKLGLTFDMADDGVEAVKLFEKNSYDAILMDENMPNMSGIEATKEIREIEKNKNLKHTPIIALTANAIKGDRERFLEAGMDEYLTKPINKEKLTQTLKKFIG